MPETRPVVLVIGAGPGVSGSVARAFAHEGYDVALLGRSADVLADLVATLPTGVRAEVATADVTDAEATTAAITAMATALGRVDVLHFNPSAFRQKGPLTLTVAELLEDVALGVGALLTALQAARPFMAAGARVTVTGSMAADKPWHEAASLGVQKAGVRNLVHSIDAALAPDGIRSRCAGRSRRTARSAPTVWPTRSWRPPGRTRARGGPRSPTRVTDGSPR